MINIGNDWQQFFDYEQDKEYYKNLKQFLIEEYNKNIIYPPKEDIFNAFKLTPINNIKVVIIGQDCYHGEGQAMGLSFSVNEYVKTPPSLLNIKKELLKEGFSLDSWSNDLTRWANQGVFLLNTILTVREHQPLSHANHGWEILTDNAIKEIEKCDNPICYLLWGKNAQSKSKLITNRNHKVFISAHPSPLSASRGFFGNNHFKLANDFLKYNNLKEIVW